jgi:drug/metabolite transporter (DMT)-like permease
VAFLQNANFARAVAILMLSILLFDVMGAIIKHLGGRYPAQELSMFRNLFGLIPSLILLATSRQWREAGRPIAIRQWRLGLLRGGFVAAAQFCFYLSLLHMEFATASAISFAGPLFITALSVPVLRAHVGVWRWAAVITGFAGVMLVLRPGGEDFSPHALLPLAAALGYASNNITAQLFDRDVPTPLLNLYSLAGSLVASTAIVIASGAFVPVASGADWLWLLAMGMAGGLAVFCLVSAYRLGEPSSLSPFEYLGIPSAFVVGYLAFGEAPFDRLIPGVFLIVAAGMIIVWRERRMRRAG